MVDGCDGGECSCDCDPAMKDKIEGMSVSGQDGDVTISLKGKKIEVSEIENAVKECSF